MFSSSYNHQSQYQHRRRKLRQNHRKKTSLNLKQPLLIHRFRQILFDLKRSSSRFLSYTISELEPICQQIAIQQMSSSSTATINTFCPLICIFCENLIYEPITLYCGHTYCEQCLKDEEFLSTSIDCPRCSKDIQGQIQSPILYAKEKNFSKNHFLKQIFDHSETLKFKCKNILLCHQAQNEYTKKKLRTCN